MTDSVRLICLKFMRDQLSAIAAPDFSLSMSTALLGPIADGASRRRFSVGVVPGKEMVEDRFPLTECILPVVVEFQITWNAGDPVPQELAENALADIQRKLKEDIYCAGNAIDLRETGNEINLNLYSDKSIDGWVKYDLLYRHNTGDPRSPV
jgi:hypothetical protein